MELDEAYVPQSLTGSFDPPTAVGRAVPSTGTEGISSPCWLRRRRLVLRWESFRPPAVALRLAQASPINLMVPNFGAVIGYADHRFFCFREVFQHRKLSTDNFNRTCDVAWFGISGNMRALFVILSFIISAISITFDFTHPSPDSRACLSGLCRYDQVFAAIDARE